MADTPGLAPSLPSSERRQHERRELPDRRRRGRPPLSADVAQLTVRLPRALRERLVECARRRGEDDIAVTHRELLAFALEAESIFASQNSWVRQFLRAASALFASQKSDPL